MRFFLWFSNTVRNYTNFFLYSLYFDAEKYLSLDTRKVAINRGWRSKIRLSSTSGLFALIASRSSLTPSTCWSDWSLDTEMSLGSIIYRSSLDVMAMCTKLNRPWNSFWVRTGKPMTRSWGGCISIICGQRLSTDVRVVIFWKKLSNHESRTI